MRSCRRSGRTGGRDRLSVRGEVSGLWCDVGTDLAVPVSVHVVPGPLVSSAQQSSLGDVHPEYALSVLEELYRRLAGSVLTAALLPAPLHHQPLPLSAGALLQRRVALALEIELPLSTALLELVLCVGHSKSHQEDYHRPVSLHYFAC